MTMNLSQWDDKTEITVEELAGLSPDQRFLADIRDPAAFDRGTVPGAMNLEPPWRSRKAAWTCRKTGSSSWCACGGRSAWAWPPISGTRDTLPFPWQGATPCGSRNGWNGKTPWRRKIPSG